MFDQQYLDLFCDYGQENGPGPWNRATMAPPPTPTPSPTYTQTRSILPTPSPPRVCESVGQVAGKSMEGVSLHPPPPEIVETELSSFFFNRLVVIVRVGSASQTISNR